MSAALDPYTLDEDLMQATRDGGASSPGSSWSPAFTRALPGPYLVSENSDRELLIVAPWSPLVRPDRAPVFGDYRGAHIATITHHGRGQDGAATYAQAAAHAVLLAASPRLLASLEAIVGILVGPVDDDLDELADQILEAQAAIADAKRMIP